MTPSSPPQPPSRPHQILLGRLPLAESRYLADALRQETVGGALLLIGAITGIVLANSPAQDWYFELRDTVVGPAALNLDLTVETWAKDGLLAIFFFVAGLELKRELVVGSLRDPAQAVLPIVAAVAGMVVPALVFLVVASRSDGASAGWAVPMATDIAFALAVLAVVGSHLPASLRAFLLTLAVVDDMGAITVIAIFYTDSFHLAAFLAALALLAVYAYVQHRRVHAWWAYLPIALLTWYAMHEAGIHATVAGVLLGLLPRVRPDPGEDHSPAEDLEHRVRPLSAGVAVPVFAFLAAGVALNRDAFGAAVGDAAAVGVVAGLVIGKFVGVFGGSWLTARFTRAELDTDLSWTDMAGLALLSGIGFTVSLLITELAYTDQLIRAEHVKAGVLVGSVLAAVLAAVILKKRDRVYRRVEADNRPDLNSQTG
ncbi:MAG: Na+/H+ antiporter NhaA [Actinomycetota bacterium]|nr:Na+/H+ antiporter NhaA [Actinomycetota bacterium]